MTCGEIDCDCLKGLQRRQRYFLTRIPRKRPLLVGVRKRRGRSKAILVVLIGFVDETGLELVLHDRVGIPGRTLNLLRRELLEDVVKCRGVVPLIGRLGQGVIHGLFVPLDSRKRILVFVFHAEHVAEFVECGATAVRRGKVPPVHGRRLVQRIPQYAAADRRS